MITSSRPACARRKGSRMARTAQRAAAQRAAAAACSPAAAARAPPRRIEPPLCVLVNNLCQICIAVPHGPGALHGQSGESSSKNDSLIVRCDTQRRLFSTVPLLSFVPDLREPPNGCSPTAAPVHLSFT